MNLHVDTTTNTTVSVMEREPKTLEGAKLTAVNDLAFAKPALIESARFMDQYNLTWLELTIWTNRGMVTVTVPRHPSQSISIQD